MSLAIPESVQQLFTEDSVSKNFRVQFPGTNHRDLVNADIVSESVILTESICSSTPIRFGLSENSSLEFKMFLNENITGAKIVAYIEIDITSIPSSEVQGQTSPDVPYRFYRIPYGTFYVDTCKRDAGTDIRTIIAYRRKKSDFYPDIGDLPPIEWGKLSCINFNLYDKEQAKQVTNFSLGFYSLLQMADTTGVWLDTFNIPHNVSTVTPSSVLWENYPAINVNGDFNYSGYNPVNANRDVESDEAGEEPIVINIEDQTKPLGVIHEFYLKTYSLSRTPKHLRVDFELDQDDNIEVSGTYASSAYLSPDNVYHITWDMPDMDELESEIGCYLDYQAYVTVLCSPLKLDETYRSNLNAYSIPYDIPYWERSSSTKCDVWFCPSLNGLPKFEQDLIFGLTEISPDVQLNIPIGVWVKTSTITAGGTTITWKYYSFYSNIQSMHMNIECVNLNNNNYVINVPAVKEDNSITIIDEDTNISTTYDNFNVTANIRDKLDIAKYAVHYSEINEYLLYVDRYDTWKTKRLLNTAKLYPRNNLYPSETLYPQDGNHLIYRSLCKSAWWDDEWNRPYDVVEYSYNGRTFTADIVDTTSNSYDPNNYTHYKISENSILENYVLENQFSVVRQFLSTMASYLLELNYYKANIQMRALPYMEAGDELLILTKDDGISTFALRHRITGVQCLMDNIEAN